jgi:acyl carrier protein
VGFSDAAHAYAEIEDNYNVEIPLDEVPNIKTLEIFIGILKRSNRRPLGYGKNLI